MLKFETSTRRLLKVPILYKIILPISLFLFSCSMDWDKLTDPNLPYWTTEFEIPLGYNVISFEDFIDDTSFTKIKKYAGSDSILYAMEENITIDPILIENNNTNSDISPIYQSIQEVLNQVSLADISTNEGSNPPIEFQLQDINPNLIDINGETTILPPFNINDVRKNFDFPNFDEATFASGMLTISLENNLPIPLEQIEIKLEYFSEETGSLIEIASSTIEQINPSQTGIGVISLGGLTLPKNIFVNISGFSPGSDPNALIINIEDSFSVSIEASDLIITSAIAEIPPIVPRESTQNINITINNESNNTIQKAMFGDCSLNLTIENNFDFEISLDLKIMNIVDYGQSTTFSNGGDTLNLVISSDKKTISTHEYPLNNYWLDLLNDSQPNITYSYDVSIYTPSSGTSNVDQYDSISIDFAIFGNNPDSTIIFSKIKGIVETFEINIESIEHTMVSISDDIDMNNFELVPFDNYVGDALEMALSLQTDEINSLGIPIQLQLTVQAICESDTCSSYLLYEINENFDITNEYGSITNSQIVIPDPHLLLNSNPEKILMSGKVLAGSLDGQTLIFSPPQEDLYIEGEFNLTVPFVFHLTDDIIISDGPEGFLAISAFEDVTETALFIQSRNQFDFGAKLKIGIGPDSTYFLDSCIEDVSCAIYDSLFIHPNQLYTDTLFLDSTQVSVFQDKFYMTTEVILSDFIEAGAENLPEIYFLSTDSLTLSIYTIIEQLINEPDESD